MKKKIWLIPIIFTVFLLSGCSKKVADQTTIKNVRNSNTLTWGVEGDKKLFSLIDVHDDQVKGFEIDLAKAITKEILGPKGQSRFVLATSQSRVPLLKNGNVDAVIATMTITPERQKVINFSNVYFNAGKTLLVPKDSDIKSVKDLNGKTVIGILGDNSVQAVKKYAPKAKVIAMQDYGQAVSALKSHQGDALTSDNGVLFGLAAENPVLKVCGGTFTKEPYGIAVNKHQAGLEKAINQAIAHLQHSGKYNQLVKKWFSQVPGFNYRQLYK
ncbi:transporter substrate-binding domain-containing protein [Lactobacillus sp. ESL0684]|uniref:transporter substrate-binding domain-containing protein n=1 Tax=unclassified Lactobacillus TaxID=2620435 RepID=UPI0023F86367|nr:MULTISPECIES: transporter substrate-binding domain-containing protein [unclassified Lactobacillus]WEV40939.1 transporter substrate-binding domain-containing protein [Lactobacillus sp. ESL0681]WEV44229.1 transporter substrate-binding domain-containing protein [Lactobacillus sp. ESL0684]